MRDKLGSRVCEECCHNPESYNRQDMLSRGQDPGEECRKCGEGLLVAGYALRTEPVHYHPGSGGADPGTVWGKAL